MTIQQLKCFIAMSEELHYSKAANKLHISQPSLSYSIAELEKELNIPLFERRDNRTCMTKQAEQLLPYVSVALNRIDDLKIKADELTDPLAGSVDLGIIYSISFDFVPKMLESFYYHTDNSRVLINVNQGLSHPLADRLLRGDLDLVLCGKIETEPLRSTYMLNQELKLVVSTEHPLAARSVVSMEDLRNETIVTLGENSNIRSHIAACFKSRNIPVQFGRSVAECSALGAFISSNMGVAVAPIVPSFNSTNVRAIPFIEQDQALLSREVYLHWVSGRYMTPTVRHFRDFLIAEFSEKKN